MHRGSWLAFLSAGVALALFCSAAVSAVEEAEPQYSESGVYGVAVALFEWRDAGRERTVPVKVYAPEGQRHCPVVLFSHGAGGSRGGYEYLGRHWASHGYLCVHLQHAGSDAEVWRGSADPLEAIRRATMDPRNAVERPRDVRFVLGMLADLNKREHWLRGRADLGRVGMAGHSFGAHTTLIVAGQSFVLPRGRQWSMADGRVRAAVAMSSPAPPRPDTWRQAFSGVDIPCLHMTGTLDESPIRETRPEDRRVAYDNINGPPQYLVTFQGGDHMVFSGRGRLRPGPKDAEFQRLIRAGSLAFWDAYLREDQRALRWLRDGGYRAALGEEAVLEQKHTRTRQPPR